MEINQEPDQIARFARMLGVFFLAAGAGSLLVLIFAFGQFLTEPESVFSVGLFTEFLESDAAAVTVIIDGREAIIDIDPTLRLILVIFVGAISILALGSILHACIGGGLSLVKFANQRPGANGT